MKWFTRLLIPCSVAALAVACNGGSGASTATDTTAAKTDSTASTGSTAGFKLGVQMWTFMKYKFVDAIAKVDSVGIKNIEAYDGQQLGGGMAGSFGPKMSAADKEKVKQLLQTKGIHVVAMGVIVPKDLKEWIGYFEFAKEFGLSYLTAEPIKTQWDMVDSLAGAYNIPVAIHDHPKPNMYWSPDSVVAAIKGHSHIGSCADIGHWTTNGLNPVECLKKLEGHIIGVHLKDKTKFDDLNNRDTVVSQGVVDFPAVFKELKRQNFSGMMSIEHESNWFHQVPDVLLTRKYYDSLVATLK